MSPHRRAAGEIKHRLTGAILYRSETAETLGDAVVEAVRARADLRGADLRGADLRGAYLRDADLRDAYLRRANLSRANLSDANLLDAYLRRANLSRANLSGTNLGYADLLDANLGGANLRGANLGGANLGGANLSRADLTDANLTGANLTDANLRPIRDDVYQILDARPAEVPGLLQALEEGRVDGSTYGGYCACLVGTIAHVAQCDYRQLEGLAPDASRPAERFFLAIQPGDTPGTSQPAAIAAEWIREWLEAHPEVQR